MDHGSCLVTRLLSESHEDKYRADLKSFILSQEGVQVKKTWAPSFLLIVLPVHKIQDSREYFNNNSD